MPLINTKLLPLKLLIFFLYGAFGCLPPFLTLHMFYIGLTIGEVTWINTIIPITALIGPPAAGYICDRFGHYRLITICSMLLSAFFSTALLFVPERAALQDTQIASIACGPQGSSLILPTCGGKCPHLSELQEIDFRVKNCRFECSPEKDSCLAKSRSTPLVATGNATIQPEVTITSTPEACFDRHGHQLCKSLEPASFINIKAQFYEESYNIFFDDQSCCEYSIGNITLSYDTFTSLTCEPSSENCFVVCDFNPKKNSTKQLKEAECDKHSGGSGGSTFWLYFFLRVCVEMFPAILISLMDAVILTMVEQHGGDFGRQKLLGSIAVCVSAPIVGQLMDQKVGVQGRYIYSPVFYVFDFLMVITAFLTLSLPFKVEMQKSSWFHNLKQLIKTPEFNVLLSVVISLGMLWGFLETFLYIHLLEDLNATKFLIGLTITVGTIPALPFLYKSDTVVRICGHHYLFILAFICYCIRFVGMAYMTNPWWIFPMEALEVFTLFLVQVAAATLTYKIASKSLVCTAQGLVWLCHFNIGRCFGTAIGGYLTKVYGIITVFEIASVFSGIFAALYLGLNHYYQRRKAKREQIEQTLEQKPNGNIPNGNAQYVPLAVNELD